MVTGGAQGLGRAIVDRLTAAGAALAVLDRDTAGLEAVRADHPAVVTVPVDLTDADAADAAVGTAFDALDGLDILVNNAGLIRNAPLVDLLRRTTRAERLALWDTVIATNLTAVHAVTMSVAERMARRRLKGVIVSIGSICARGNPGQSAYAAAKAGIEALTATWARELGPLGIRAVCVAPGFADTPSTHAALTGARVAEVAGEVPLRRLGTADEVALAVQQAIENGYINGTVLRVDGGLVM
nr:SDR family NAD(P)-dependent oxidoreductase [Roseospira goensis]